MIGDALIPGLTLLAVLALVAWWPNRKRRTPDRGYSRSNQGARR